MFIIIYTNKNICYHSINKEKTLFLLKMRGEKMRLDAKLLRGVLYERDLTQSELADKSKVAFVTVNKVCNGGSCTYETGKKIADSLGMKLEDLLEKRGN